MHPLPFTAKSAFTELRTWNEKKLLRVWKGLLLHNTSLFTLNFSAFKKRLLIVLIKQT